MKNIYELNQNIYITSDEEIKEGDWFLEKAGRQYPIHWNDVDKLNRHCKKIILTTDPLLDGVQAIDDEFLEWFTKNPSREYVNFISYGNEKGTKEFRKVPITFVPDERRYSEEDMIRFAEFVATYPDKNKNVHGQMLHAKSKYDGSERTIDLLEQFKNK